MCFQGNPAPIIIYSDKITIVTFKVHGHTGVFDIFPDIRAGSVIGLQVTPEQSFPDGNFIGRKTGQSLIQSLL